MCKVYVGGPTSNETPSFLASLIISYNLLYSFKATFEIIADSTDLADSADRLKASVTAEFLNGNRAISVGDSIRSLKGKWRTEIETVLML